MYVYIHFLFLSIYIFFKFCILILQPHSSKPSILITRIRTREPGCLGANPGITIYNCTILEGIFNSLWLSFLICKIRVTVIPTFHIFSRHLFLTVLTLYLTGSSRVLLLPVVDGMFPKVPSVINQKLYWKHYMMPAALGSKKT